MAFQELSAIDDKGKRKPIFSVSHEVVSLLESITAAEKAQAVPYLKIWQVDPHTGRPVNEKNGEPKAALSLQLSAPPRFGSSVKTGDDRYRERPPVSLERVIIKTDSPKGIIMYRTLEISFMVHRPDVIFGELDPDGDNWATLLIPGAVHAMEYGWRASAGVKNGLLNGDGFVDRSQNPPVIVPAVNRIRFTVTNYSFRIAPDNQYIINLTAYEDGEFNLRQAFIGLDSGNNFPQANRISTELPRELYSDDSQKLVNSLKDKFKKITEQAKKGKHGKQITFKELADGMFAPVIEKAYKDLGYQSADLFFGLFNERAGVTSAKYGARDMTGSSIGQFILPVSEVEQVFNNLMKVGHQLTLYNFLLPFVRMIRSPECWNGTLARKDGDGQQMTAIPEVIIKTVFNKARNGKTSALFYILDAKREYTKFAAEERDLERGKNMTRSQIREKLKEKGVPMISFGKGNSYIQDANFEVVNDEQIKAIFMRRYLNPTRADIQDVAKKRKVSYVDPRQLLYSSAIQGDIVMLGNFVFDMFGLLWLDFGVRQWSGPFIVRSREDVIQRGSFLTKISLVSEGDDPLGTQGKVDLMKP